MRVVFHVGLHKTASSWLQSVYFEDHPEIVLLNDYQEPWNDPFLCYLITTPETHFDIRKCRKIFERLVEDVEVKGNASERLMMISSERLSGHPFSGGFDRIQILKRLKAVFPTVEVLLIIRSQIDAITSVYKQLVAEGCTSSIEDLLQQDCWKTSGFSKSYWDYFKYVDMAAKLLGKDAVKVLCYEQMRVDINGFLRQLCEDLDVSYYQSKNIGEIINPSLPDGSVNLLRRLNHLRQSEMNPQPMIKLNVIHRSLYNLIVKFSGSMFAKKNLFLQSEYEPLEQHYAHDNRRLMNLLDIDLAKYNYPL